MLLAKLPTPLLPTLRGEDCARLAAAKKPITGKELVNDGLGLRIILSEAKRRDFHKSANPMFIAAITASRCSTLTFGHGKSVRVGLP